MMELKKWPLWLGVIVLLALFAATVIARLIIYRDGIWPDNRDAPYHVLLIVKAYAATPFSHHLLLPIVSLGQPMDKWIGWGSVLMTDRGNAIYLSFPPLGFIVPYLFHAALSLKPTLISLMAFNMGIHFLTAGLVGLLGIRAAQAAGAMPIRSYWIGVFSAASYVLAREALMTHGPTYWSHSLYQPILVGQLLLLLSVLQDRPLGAKKLLLLSVLGPSVEWTGYLTNAGISLCLGYQFWRTGNRVYFKLSLWVFGCTVLALALFFIHVLRLVSLGELVGYLHSRIAMRMDSGPIASSVYVWKILYAQVQSTGGLFVLGLGCVVALFIRRTLKHRVLALVCLAAALPVMENYLLKQHALEYHFDRTKLIVPLVLVISFAAALPGRRWTNAVFGLWTAAIVSNVVLFAFDPRALLVKEGTDISEKMWSQVKQFDGGCVLVTAATIIRGYENEVTGRSIIERIPNVNAMQAETVKRGACRGIWLSSAPYPDGWWNRAYVFEPATGITSLLRIDGTHEKIDAFPWSPESQRALAEK